jgi:hypothetical protein
MTVLAWLGRLTASSKQGFKVLSHIMESGDILEGFEDEISDGGKYVRDIFYRGYGNAYELFRKS